MLSRTQLDKERVGTLKCRNRVGFHIDNENHLRRLTVELSRMNTVDSSKVRLEE